MNITPEQALANLYNATRLAPLKADDHQVLAECAKVLQEAISPKEEKKED
jgi:hypothetical protein